MNNGDSRDSGESARQKWWWKWMTHTSGRQTLRRVRIWDVKGIWGRQSGPREWELWETIYRVCAKNKRALQWQRTRVAISPGEKLLKWPYWGSYGLRGLEEVWVILRYLMRGFWKSWDSSSYSSVSKKSWNLGIILMDLFPQLQVKLGSFKLHYISGWSLSTAKPWQPCLLI